MEAPYPSGQRTVRVYLPRAIEVALYIILNYVLFFVIPSRFFESVGRLTPEVEATATFYFVSIGTLSAIQTMLKDHVLGSASGVGLGLVEAVYLFTITQGGILDITFEGFAITLEFKPILYLMMTYPMLGTVKKVLETVHRSSSQAIYTVEAV